MNCRDCTLNLPPENTRGLCKPCHNARQRERDGPKYRAANRTKAIEDERNWRLNNPEKYKAKMLRQTENRRRAREADSVSRSPNSGDPNGIV